MKFNSTPNRALSTTPTFTFFDDSEHPVTYLRVILDCKLDFSKEMDRVCSRGNSGIFVELEDLEWELVIV